MDLVKLTEELVLSIAPDPDSVSIKLFDTEDDSILIEVMVSEEHIGAVIGHKGKIANAIRTLVQASGHLQGHKQVRINFDSF